MTHPNHSTATINKPLELLTQLAARALSVTPPHVHGIDDCDLARVIKEREGRWADFVPQLLADNWDALSAEVQMAAFVSALDCGWSSDGGSACGSS
jgi:hypothetical protein